MTQVVASHPFCPENSTHLTRISSHSFYRIDGNDAPTIIDKNQAKHRYHLQRAPNVNTSLHLESSEKDYKVQRHSENTPRTQVNGYCVQPIRTVYHRPSDMSDTSMTTVRNYPSTIIDFRQEDGSNNGFIPCLSDRSDSNKTVCNRIGLGGGLSLDEDRKQVENYFQNNGHSSSQPDWMYTPRKQQDFITNELSRHFSFTSAYDEIPRDSQLSSKVSTSSTTSETNGENSLLKSQSHSSLYDKRNCDILNWDRTQVRHVHYYRKPIDNIAPLPRAQQISGYSGSIGGSNLEDIDNPTVDFKPYTVLRTEQPKYSTRSSKANIPFYTGSSHWTKIDPVSHFDQSGNAYTTTAATHTSLPFDNSSYRHADSYGLFSKSVTNIMPYNPYNQMDNFSATNNGSLDSRPSLILQQLPRTKLPPTTYRMKKDEPNVTNEVNTPK